MKREKALRRICIILPAYNEGKVIASVVRGIPRDYKHHGERLLIDVLVVDDGSADSTSEAVQGIEGVKVVRHIVNMGAGAATRTGLHYARNKQCALAVTMDADGQHAINDVLGLIAKMLDNPEIDLLIGSRLLGNGNMSTFKRAGNIGLNYITFLLLGTYVSDSQSGLRVFSRRCLDTLYFHSNNYAFCSEMIWQAKRAGLRIAEHPVEAIYTEYSTTKDQRQRNVSAGFKILQQLIVRRFMDILQ